MACLGAKDILFDARRERVGHRVLERQMPVRIALPRAQTQPPIRRGEQVIDRALRDLEARALTVQCGYEFQIRADQRPVCAGCRAEWITDCTQQRLDLGAAGVRFGQLEFIKIVTVDRQSRDLGAERLETAAPDAEHLRRGKGARLAVRGGQSARLPLAGAGGAVVRIHAAVHASVGVELIQPYFKVAACLEKLEQLLGVAQRPGEARQLRQLRF